MGKLLRTFLIAAACYLVGTATVFSAESADFQVAAVATAKCKTAHKTRCLVLRVANTGPLTIRFPLIPSIRGSDVVAHTTFAVFESTPVDLVDPTWTPVFASDSDGITIFPQRAVAEPGQAIDILVELPKWPAAVRDHAFRVALHDENDVVRYSNGFDASGKLISRQPSN